MQEKEEEAKTSHVNETLETVVKHGVKGVSDLKKIKPSHGEEICR